MREPIHLILSIFITLLGAYFITAPPPGAIEPYLDGIFPDTPPGEGNLWQLEDPMPHLGLPSPIKILPLDDNNTLMVLSKRGEVYLVDRDQQSKTLVLDIKDRTFKLGDAGSVGMALHPKFGDPNHPDRQEIFIYYKTKKEIDIFGSIGYNRLSRFQWDVDAQNFDADSEQILIQQYDRSEWHDGGGMFFGDDGFLYLSIGDEGKEEFQKDSNQRLDGGFFAGILRLDVDNDPAKSHPIRRQPKPNAQPLDDWGETFSQGYGIPNDNPWLDPNGGILEEFVVLGIRSPFTMHLDRPTGEIWLADVGSDKREEINIAAIGDNLQWPYMEGKLPSETHTKPDPFIGNEKAVYFEYERDIGTCVIGGGIYRNDYFTELNEKYLFADFTAKKIMALSKTGSNNEPEFEVLLNNLSAQPVELPVKPRISGIHIQEDGNIFVTIYGESADSLSKIFQLKRISAVMDPPAKLSELNVFKNMESLEVRSGILPYDVNAPLWSDGASKKRWIALPNDGSFDEAHEQIKYSKTNPWDFPEGTVFIKHFELPLTTEQNGENARLETRFFIIGKGKKGYGLTYKWNEEGTEAYLLGGGSSRHFDITSDGEYAYTQTWDFPSRDQCITCHNDNADYVLGVNTHQLNGTFNYTDTERHQLEYWNKLGIFGSQVVINGFEPKSYAISDENIELGKRIRSYLDANCASCHQEGGIPDINLDFRYTNGRNLKEYIDFPTASHASAENRSIIELGDHSESELWIRDSSNEDNRMPPLGRNKVDQIYIDSLAKWIDNLEPLTSPAHHELIVFPNPTTGWIGIRIDSDWTPPYFIDISSISGRNIWQTSTDQNFEYFDLTHAPTGNYLITARSGDRVQTRKFVIQR